MIHWQHTITVYHRSTDFGGVVNWARRVYRRCWWGSKRSTSTNSGMAKASATNVVRIPGSAELAPGDIVVYGTVEDDINEYMTGMRSTDIRARYSDSFIVNEVHNNSLLGCPLPHTYAEGA